VLVGGPAPYLATVWKSGEDRGMCAGVPSAEARELERGESFSSLPLLSWLSSVRTESRASTC
jgi:hypothetical protein